MRVLASAVLVVAQLAPTIGIMVAQNAKVNAAQVCTNDQQGANDTGSTQRDLTRLCVDSAGLPTSMSVVWDWDKVNFTGSNTGDACALFDTDGDGFANYAACVTVTGSPATQSAGSPKLYTCGDTRFDRCTSAALIAGPYTSTCSVNQQNTDPFGSGEASPVDTVATCTLAVAEVGGANAKMLDVCALSSQQVNSDPADCIISKGESKLEVVKSLSPSADLGKFNLSIGGTVYASAVGDGGTTGERAQDNGNDVEFRETAAAGTSLSNYTIGVVCKKSNGTGSTVSVSTISTGRFSIEMPDNEDVKCTITNTRSQGSLKVVKNVINDNGGTKKFSDFTFTVNGGTANTFTDSGNGEDGTKTLSLPTGVSYTVVEPEANSNGYTTSYSGCSNISLVANQESVCTITNNDVSPELTVIKHVVNDNNGSAVASNFTMNVTATSPSQSSFAGSEAGTKITLSAGSYSVSEGASTAYEATYSADCSGTIAIGEKKTCTVTNDDKTGTLIVKKELTKDNGGTEQYTDFSFSINQGASTWFESDGENSFTVNAGTYSVSENETSAYATTYENCTNVVVPNGESRTCTIKNNDVAPKLTVTKIVDNTEYNGSLTVSDFKLYVGTTVVTSGVQNSFDSGTVTVSEDEDDGYTGVISGDCASDGSISLQLGGSYACVITNTALPATLKIVKKLSNDNGATKAVTDFSYDVNTGEYGGYFDANGEVTLTLPAGIYSVDENEENLYGYETTYDSCSNIVIGNGESATCTITNEDKPATLIVQKNLITDNGGSENVTDFSFKVDGVTHTFEEDGVNSISLNAGSYSVVEDETEGYTTSYSNDCKDLNLVAGQTVTCTITNDDIAPNLTLVKEVTNDNGGTAQASDWSLDASGPTSIKGLGGAVSGTDFKAGTYTLSEDGPSGYTASDWTCTNGFEVDDNQITLDINESTTCTITNDDNEPRLVLNKILSVDSGGDEAESDWTLSANGPTTFSGSGQSGSSDVDSDAEVKNFEAGTYTLGETNDISGYTSSSWSCTNSVVVSTDNTITLGLGDSTVCSITNSDVAPEITLEKKVVDEYRGLKQPSDWTLSAVPQDDSLDTISGSGDITALDGVVDRKAYSNVVYELSEYGPDGYEGSEWVCSGEGFIQPDNDKGNNEITLSEGASVNCVITNTALVPTLTINKHLETVDEQAYFESEFDFTLNRDDDAEPFAEFTLDGDGDDGDGTLSSTKIDITAGEFVLVEQKVDGWFQQSVTCTDNGEEIKLSTLISFTARLGHDYVCDVYNEEEATVNVYKYFDYDLDGEFNPEKEELLDGFVMELCEYVGAGITTNTVEKDCPKETTGSDGEGQSTFNVQSGSYTLDEILEENSSWVMIGKSCESNYPNTNRVSRGVRDYDLYVRAGDVINCYIGNNRAPIITLAKENDTSGIAQQIGDEVTYTLTINVSEDGGSITDPVVVDTPPEDFEYITGSWSAESDSRGDLKDQGISVEPDYASPGKWLFSGDESSQNYFLPGEQIVLTYRAIIGDSITDGTYPDIAYLYGESVETIENEDVVFANLLNTEPETPFVNTEVLVATAEKTSIPVVLGVSTLQKTGQSIIVQLLIGTALIIGVIMLTKRTKSSDKKKYVVLSMFIVTSTMLGAVMFSGSKAFATSTVRFWTVTMSTPEPTTNLSSFVINYQVTSTVPDDAFTVELLQDGAVVATQNVTSTGKGGNSGQFTVPALTVEDTYDYEVRATNISAGDPPKVTTVNSVDYDKTKPAVADYEGVVRDGNKYTLSFSATSNDAKIARIYGSKETSFSANAQTQIGQVDLNGVGDYTFVYNAPDDDQRYFAIVIEDTAGNLSGVASDTQTQVVLVEDQTTTGVNGTSTTTNGASKPEVAGETTKTPTPSLTNEATANTTSKDGAKSNLVRNVAGLAVVALIVGYLVRQNRQDGNVLETKTSASKSTKKSSKK